MGPIGMPEMMFIFVLALVLFGPKKLPELGRLLGRGLTEFRRAKNELKTTFETHMRELEREANLEKDKQSSTSSYKPDYSSPRYPYSYDEYGQDEYTSGTSDSTAAIEAPAEHPTPVASVQGPSSNGTVARTNGVQPVEHVTEHVAEEEHRPA